MGLEAKTTQRTRVRALTSKKPYKKKISYVSEKGRRKGKRITYEQYYSWMKKMFRDGKYREGYLRVSKPTYLEAMVIWKKLNR